MDDEVEIVSTNMWDIFQFFYNRESFHCQFCFVDLTTLTVARREEHYAKHLDPEKSSPGPSRTAKSVKGTSDKAKHKVLDKLHLTPFTSKDKDDFWYGRLKASPPHNFTPGIIHLLKKDLLQLYSQGKIERAALCRPQAVHITTRFDRGWGCGYRNYMMACTALMDQDEQPRYRDLLTQYAEPVVYGLQHVLQKTWDAGIDKEGKEHLSPIINSVKWIGTSDLWAAFSYQGIPSELVDFNANNPGSRGTVALIEWVVRYFSLTTPLSNVNDALRGASPVVMTDKMPIILQHQGHSRTIIGYERLKTGKVNFLMFDPSYKCSPAIRRAGIMAHKANVKLRATAGEASRKGQEIPADDEVVIVGESSSSKGPVDSNVSIDGLDLKDFKIFRLKAQNLTHKKYQLLHFPMSDPLTPQQIRQNVIVRSTVYN